MTDRKVYTEDEIKSLLSDANVREFFENHVTGFNVTVLPVDVVHDEEAYHWLIRVENRSFGKWAVSDGFRQYNREGEKGYESLPSSRTDEFKQTFRHDLETAVSIAFKVAATLKVSGYDAEKITAFIRSRSE